MYIFAEGSFDGKYPSSSPAELGKAKYVIGHEFGQPPPNEWGIVNQAIAKFIVEHYVDMPIYASTTIAGAIKEIKPEIELAGVFEGTSADTIASKGGTWMELKMAQSMRDNDWQYPILVGQSYHIGRAMRQAKKLGMIPAVPPGLPAMFDPGSLQWWCRGEVAWRFREAPGSFFLRLNQQL